MIFDCFTFFNELDLLDIRLHELDPHVDYFVISESDHTFQGQPKPYHYHDNRSLFRDFESKIIHVPVRQISPATDHWTPWEREAAQRRAIRSALLYAWNTGKVKRSPEDIVLMSDVDEIPDLRRRKWDWVNVISTDSRPVMWAMDMTYYWVDLLAGKWAGTVGMKLRDVDHLLNGDFQKLRDMRGHRTPAAVINPGGWHFSFLGGVDAIKTKIESFSHTEYRSAADERNIRESLGDRWRRGVDLFGRDIYKFRPLAAEERERLPRYLTVNRSKFSGLFMPDSEDQAAAGSGSADTADA